MRSITRFRLAGLLALLLLVPLVGCAPQMVKPETPTETAATATATLTGVYNSIADLADAGAITQPEYDKLMARADEIDEQLARAKGFIAGGFPRDALGILSLTTQALLELQGELNRKKGGTP